MSLRNARTARKSHDRSRGPALLCASLAAVAWLFAGAAAIAQEAGDEFVVAFNALEYELDPAHSIYSAEAQIFTASYEGLFTYNPETLSPVKSACESYTKSPDGRSYTFTIRKDARWSDGRSLLARDFREAWLRVISPTEAGDYAAFFDVIAGANAYRLGREKDPASVGITVTGDRELQVRLESRADYFTRLLCHHSFSPVHPSMLAVEDWRAAVPFPVNGPYRFESAAEGDLVLVKNAEYWDASSVAIQRLRFLFTDEDDEVTRRFNSGEIHWLAGPMNPDDLLDLSNFLWHPMFGTNYWFFAVKDRPWSDPELRRALALLLPWEALRSKERYQFPASTLVLPLEGYKDVKGIEKENEAEARELLAKAGFPDGKGLPTLVILGSEGENAKTITDLMKSAWERLPEFKVEVKVLAPDRYFEAVRAGPAASGYDLAQTTWIGDFADPLAFLQMWKSDSNLNDGGYADPEYDELLASASEKEGQERLAVLARAESRLLSTGAVLPIYYSLAINVLDAQYITGWYPNALDIHPFKYLGFGQRTIRPNVALAAR